MMEGTRFYKLIIIALVALNVGTLAYFQLTKPPHPPRPDRGNLTRQLELENGVKSKVDAFAKQHHMDKKVLIQKDHELHRKLFNRIGSGKPTYDLLDQIDKNKSKIESMTFIFFDDVAKHCNENQKKKLIKFVQKRLNRIRPGPPPPRR